MNYIDNQINQNNDYIIILLHKVEKLNIELHQTKKALKKAYQVEKSLNQIKNK